MNVSSNQDSLAPICAREIEIINFLQLYSNESTSTFWVKSYIPTADIARVGGHYAVQGQFQGHWFWYQSKARMRFPIRKYY